MVSRLSHKQQLIEMVRMSVTGDCYTDPFFNSVNRVGQCILNNNCENYQGRYEKALKLLPYYFTSEEMFEILL